MNLKKIRPKRNVNNITNVANLTEKTQSPEDRKKTQTEKKSKTIVNILVSPNEMKQTINESTKDLPKEKGKDIL